MSNIWMSSFNGIKRVKGLIVLYMGWIDQQKILINLTSLIIKLIFPLQKQKTDAESDI